MNPTQDQTFIRKDFTALQPATEYEACEFLHCNFSKADLSDFRFVDCIFTDCDWSNARLAKTTLNDVRFTGCKALGLPFHDCNDGLFTVAFNHCNLSFSSFHGRTMKKTNFTACLLHEADFTEAVLTGSAFDGCDLQRAVFENTVLEKADFRTAFNFNIDPERNKLKKARFGNANLAGLLAKYDLDVD